MREMKISKFLLGRRTEIINGVEIKLVHFFIQINGVIKHLTTFQEPYSDVECLSVALIDALQDIGIFEIDYDYGFEMSNGSIDTAVHIVKITSNKNNATVVTSCTRNKEITKGFTDDEMIADWKTLGYELEIFDFNK